MTTRHQHVCGCGDYFMCSQLPDRCPREPWQCPKCEQDQLDEWANALDHDAARAFLRDAFNETIKESHANLRERK